MSNNNAYDNDDFERVFWVVYSAVVRKYAKEVEAAFLVRKQELNELIPE